MVSGWWIASLTPGGLAVLAVEGTPLRGQKCRRKSNRWNRRESKAGRQQPGTHAPASLAWTYRLDAQHGSFDILEGGAPWCRGVVFSSADVLASTVVG